MSTRNSHRPIHILFLLISQSVGGAETHAVSLVNGLDKKKFRISLVYLKDQADGAGVTDGIDDAITVFCAQVNKKFDFNATRKLSKFIREEQVDVIVCANPFPLLYATVLKKISLRTLKVVEILHSTEPFTRRAVLQMIAYRPMVWMSDLLIYVCENQHNYWRSKGLWARSTAVVHNGVDVAHFQNGFDPIEIENVRRRYGFAHGDYLIGACGNLRPEKSQADLVHAVHQLRQVGVDAKCLLIGDGPTRTAIQAAIDRLDLGKHIVITGLIKDIRLAVAACDVMTVPSHNETFSMAALESMALRKPVIMSNVGGARELIGHSENGYLYPKGDVSALSKHLELLAEPMRRVALGQRARETISKRFSSEIMINKYDVIFSKLVSVPSS